MIVADHEDYNYRGRGWDVDGFNNSKYSPPHQKCKTN